MVCMLAGITLKFYEQIFKKMYRMRGLISVSLEYENMIIFYLKVSILDIVLGPVANTVTSSRGDSTTQ